MITFIASKLYDNSALLKRSTIKPNEEKRKKIAIKSFISDFVGKDFQKDFMLCLFFI